MRSIFPWLALSCAACSSVAAPDASPAPALDRMSSAVPALETSSIETSTDESSSIEAAPGETAPNSEAPAVVEIVPPSAVPDGGVLVAPPAAVDAAPILLPSDAPTLVVSLTFDDTFAPQLDAAATLDAHGLHGTFYVNSPRLYDGSANGAASLYMSVEGALELQARGHEIGGHTLSHPRLTTLPESERVREIVVDRAQLLALGFAARSFAYPDGDAEGDSDPALGRSVLDVARTSGYSSARDTNGFSLANCTAGPETLPPLDAYRLRSIRSVNDHPPVADGAPPLPPDTADTLLSWMDHAVSCGGGWLPLIFHHLRPDCSAPDAPGSYCFDFSELDRLAAALAVGARCPSDGTSCYRISVATVNGALGDSPLAPALEAFGLRNASLERTLASGSTECAQDTQGTGGTAVVLGRSTDLAHSGVASERMEIVAPFVAPAEIRISRDFGACAPFATAGRAYDLGLYYRAEPGIAPMLRFITYRLTSDYVWQLWTSSEPFAALTPGEWVRQAFRTEPVPAGTIAFSFGLRLESVGAVNVDDFEGAPAAL